MGCHNPLHNSIQISCCTSLTYQYLHSISCLSHCILIIHTLMICVNSAKYICSQLPRCQKRCMAILHSVLKQLKLFMHGNTSVNHRRRIHHFTQAQNPRMFQISFAYSLTARSAEKMPAFAMLCRDILVHVSVSVYSCELCSCT